MSYEKEFKDFLQKEGNRPLGFLRSFATMDDDQVIYWDGMFSDKLLWQQRGLHRFSSESTRRQIMQSTCIHSVLI